jgi:hypothetical protein
VSERGRGNRAVRDPKAGLFNVAVVASRAGYGCQDEKGFIEKGGRYPNNDVILEIHDHNSFLSRLGEALVTQEEAKDSAKSVEEWRQAQGCPYRSKGVALGPANRRRDVVEPRHPTYFTRRHVKFCASQELSCKAEKAGGTQDEALSCDPTWLAPIKIGAINLEVAPREVGVLGGDNFPFRRDEGWGGRSAFVTQRDLLTTGVTMKSGHHRHWTHEVRIGRFRRNLDRVLAFHRPNQSTG